MNTQTKTSQTIAIKGPILLYGAGREARSTRRFLAQVAPGAEVHVAVDNGEADIEGTTRVAVETLKTAFAAGKYTLVVRSAGVSLYKPELMAAKQAGIEITTNVNLWARHKGASAKTIAITGTKGKSTTAKLVHTMLKSAGIDAGLAGNIGVPVLDAKDHEVLVLELSSFQTADLELNPDIIGITCLFPEHLDWHLNETNYFSDKMNIVRRKKPFQCALGEQVIAHFSLPQPPDGLVRALPDLETGFEAVLREQVAASKLKGNHNVENAILAARLALGAGASERAVLEGIIAFEPLPHRLQEFEIGGKIFVNDSIATNPAATRAAIASYPQEKMALIVGGYDRGQDYECFSAHLKGTDLAHVWFLPDTGHRIERGFEGQNTGFIRHNANSLAQMFEQLAADPDQFDILLLSPGAPSYNQFENFEERGEVFIELARKHFG